MMEKELLLIGSSVPKTAQLTVSYQQDAYHPVGQVVSIYYLDDPSNRILITYDQPLEVDTFREMGFMASSVSGGWFPDPIMGNYYIYPEESRGIIVRTPTDVIGTVSYFQVVAATAKVVFSFD